MIIYKEIQSYLEANPYARERRNKDHAIAFMLQDKHFADGMVNIVRLTDFAKDFTSYDRIWRLVLEENPKLRGKDYGTKDIVEQRFEVDVLHREPGYFQNVKQLRMKIK